MTSKELYAKLNDKNKLTIADVVQLLKDFRHDCFERRVSLLQDRHVGSIDEEEFKRKTEFCDGQEYGLLIALDLLKRVENREAEKK